MTLRRGALTVDTTVDDSVTQNACNVGKSRKPNLDMHGICTEKFRLTAVEFYPELAEVGKDVVEGEVSGWYNSLSSPFTKATTHISPIT